MIEKIIYAIVKVLLSFLVARAEKPTTARDAHLRSQLARELADRVRRVESCLREARNDYKNRT